MTVSCLACPGPSGLVWAHLIVCMHVLVTATGTVHPDAHHLDGAQGHIHIQAVPTLHLPTVQDSREKGSAQHYRAQHQLCPGYTDTNQQGCSTLDETWCGTADKPELIGFFAGPWSRMGLCTVRHNP